MSRILVGRKADPKYLPGVTIASVSMAAPVAVTGVYATQGQIIVPAGAGAHDLEVVGGVLYSVVTGTQPVKTTFRFDVALFDGTTLVAYNADYVAQHTDALTKTEQHTIPIAINMAPNAVDKTYTFQVRCNNIGVNGASANVLLGGAFPARLFRAVARG